MAEPECSAIGGSRNIDAVNHARPHSRNPPAEARMNGQVAKPRLAALGGELLGVADAAEFGVRKAHSTVAGDRGKNDRPGQGPPPNFIYTDYNALLHPPVL